MNDVLDLRTIYKGEMKAVSEALENMQTISNTIAEEVQNVANGILNEKSSIVLREDLANLVKLEAQMSDLIINLKTAQKESNIIRMAGEILDSLRKERAVFQGILMAILNENNNAGSV